MRAALPGMPQVMQTDPGDPRVAPLVSPRLLGSGGGVCSVSDQPLAELHSRKSAARKSCCGRWGNGGGPKVSLGHTGQPYERTGGRAAPASDKLA